MKGILGQKIGMTSVFSEHGANIPVTIIKTLPNVVTNVLTNEKHGYDAVQLSAFERCDKTVSRPVLGHFKKAQTGAKYFTKEIRNMTGFKLGATVDLSIFNVGELVDVTSTSKGKGFAGAIKRHNQKIGPKSHGGGGGSKPVRLTGGIGDVVSNRVFKGQTMPGQMGNVKRTVQNLEIIMIDQKNNVLLVKGSVPGPKKRYVIIKNAIKGLASKEAIKLVDITVSKLKNQLLEEAKRVGAEVSTAMSIDAMQKLIDTAQAAKEKEKEKLVKAKTDQETKALTEPTQTVSSQKNEPVKPSSPNRAEKGQATETSKQAGTKKDPAPNLKIAKKTKQEASSQPAPSKKEGSQDEKTNKKTILALDKNGKATQAIKPRASAKTDGEKGVK